MTHIVALSEMGSFTPVIAEWRKRCPKDGWMPYIDALTNLGRDLAAAVPKKVKAEAIPKLGEDPTSSILIGDFTPGTTTKERTLNPSCNFVSLVSVIKAGNTQRKWHLRNSHVFGITRLGSRTSGLYMLC